MERLILIITFLVGCSIKHNFEDSTQIVKHQLDLTLTQSIIEDACDRRYSTPDFPDLIERNQLIEECINDGIDGLIELLTGNTDANISI